MRFVIVSDTHGYQWHLGKIPEGDVLVSCGDWSRGHGHHREIDIFSRWMAQWSHPFKIAVAGNHDGEAEDHPTAVERLFRERGIQLLSRNQVFEYEGLRFGGAPWVPFLHGSTQPYAFQRTPEERQTLWATVPPVDVLVTHSPPYGVLDMTSRGGNLGCPELLLNVETRIRPRLHLFGHVHEGYGQLERDGTKFVNASICTRRRVETVDGIINVTVGIRSPQIVDL